MARPDRTLRDLLSTLRATRQRCYMFVVNIKYDRHPLGLYSDSFVEVCVIVTFIIL